MKARLVKFGEIEVEGTRYAHDVGDRRRQSEQAQESAFEGIPGKVRPHAAFGRGRNSVGGVSGSLSEPAPMARFQ